MQGEKRVSGCWEKKTVIAATLWRKRIAFDSRPIDSFKYNNPFISRHLIQVNFSGIIWSERDFWFLIFFFFFVVFFVFLANWRIAQSSLARPACAWPRRISAEDRVRIPKQALMALGGWYLGFHPEMSFPLEGSGTRSKRGSWFSADVLARFSVIRVASINNLMFFYIALRELLFSLEN